MKLKLMAIALLLTISTTDSFGQPTAPITSSDYLKKSKTQKIGGFILLGVGATIIAIAAPGNVSFDILPVLAVGVRVECWEAYPYLSHHRKIREEP